MTVYRVRTIIGAVLLFAGLLLWHLAKIQVIEGEEYARKGRQQQTGREIIPAERGYIYDRNSALLVYNKSDVSFYIDKNKLSKKEIDTIAQVLAKINGTTTEEVLSIINDPDKVYFCLAPKVSGEDALLLKQLKIKGLIAQSNPTRFHQFENNASHILGFMDYQFKPADGIEKSMNEYLEGTNGERIMNVDSKGRIITVLDELTKQPSQGSSVYLTIDRSVQEIVEQVTAEGVTVYGGSSATGIVMDPNSGEIIAYANYPDYNPNDVSGSTDTSRRSRGITDIYEPGSTFKAVSLSAMLDRGVVKPDETVFAENGSFSYKNATIKDAHPEGNLSVREVFAKSSNIGMSKLSQQISEEDLFGYLRGFGFGNETSIQLPGEVRGILKNPAQWSGLTKSSLSYGYEVSVTPLQMINAYSAIVNGGKLFQPMIVKKVVDNSGKVVKEFEPKVIRQVISEQTSQIMRDLMRLVVTDGTGKKAQTEEVETAGKTGTSRKFVNGEYSQQYYNSSFIGFFPYKNPRYICLVLVHAPTTKGYYGGDVAAPMFKKITEGIIGLNPELKSRKEENTNTGEENTNGSVITSVIPVKKLDKNNIKAGVMPDLTGLTVREAATVLHKIKLKYVLSGTGRITAQSIQPGTEIAPGNMVTLTGLHHEKYGVTLY